MSQLVFAPILPNEKLTHQGKTRDSYETNSPDTLLIVCTDRLSTHNIVHRSTIPLKGQVLTALTIFWLNFLGKEGLKHHLVAYGQKIYDYLPDRRASYPEDLHLYSIVVKKLRMIPVEFIFRNYLVGSLYDKFYSKDLPNPYGIDLPPNLQIMTPFVHPVFSPTDKSDTDDPLNAKVVKEEHPKAFATAEQAFMLAREHANSLGLEIVDSKMEIGIDSSGTVTLADETFTPDSSRFAESLKIKIGQEPPWFDKQIARDEAVRMWGNQKRTPLVFDQKTITKLSHTYRDICSRITGLDLPDFQAQYLE